VRRDRIEISFTIGSLSLFAEARSRIRDEKANACFLLRRSQIQLHCANAWRVRVKLRVIGAPIV
jgi:hypothetical protein